MSAAITAAAVGAAGAVAGGVIASKGAKKAGQAQQKGIDEATNLNREMWQKQQEQQAPWMQGGQTGLNALMYGLGLGGSLPGETFGGGMAEKWDPESVMGPRPTDPGGAQQWDINAATGQKQFEQNQAAGRAQLEKNLAGLTPEQRAAYENQRKAGGLTAGGLMGGGPEYQAFGEARPEYKAMTLEDFQADPGYKFRLRQGLKALDRTASARGGLLSGGALKAAEGYGQEMGSQEYGNAFNRNQINQQNVYGRYVDAFNRNQIDQNNLYNRFQTGQTNQYNRLASLAGVGQQTAQQLGQANQQYAQNAGGLMQAGGENQANALLAGANARGSMYQGIGDALGGINYNKLFSGGGSNRGAAPYGAYRGFKF